MVVQTLEKVQKMMVEDGGSANPGNWDVWKAFNTRLVQVLTKQGGAIKLSALGKVDPALKEMALW